MSDTDIREALSSIGQKRKTLREQAREESKKLRELVVSASEQGLSDAEIGRLAQVDRMTIRGWLGK